MRIRHCLLAVNSLLGLAAPARERPGATLDDVLGLLKEVRARIAAAMNVGS